MATSTSRRRLKPTTEDSNRDDAIGMIIWWRREVLIFGDNYPNMSPIVVCVDVAASAFQGYAEWWEWESKTKTSDQCCFFSRLRSTAAMMIACHLNYKNGMQGEGAAINSSRKGEQLPNPATPISVRKVRTCTHPGILTLKSVSLILSLGITRETFVLKGV